MRLFDRLFRDRRDDDPPAIPLRLQYPPTPQHAARLAEIVVEATRDIDGTVLDYTPASLKHVDRIVGGFHAEGLRPNQVGETVFSFGCYAGEVLVRNCGGAWKMPSETSLPAALQEGDNTMVVELPDGTICNPIGKAFRLLESGEGESLAYFYQVFAPKTQ